MGKTVVHRPKIKTFQLLPKDSFNSSDQVSAILYPDGHVVVGIDVFRLLNKSDMPSFPIEAYRNMHEVNKKYVPCKHSKGYYMKSLREEDQNGRNVQSGRNIC